MNALGDVVLAFCRWCNGSFFGHGIRDSVWLFPFVETFHLVALGVLGGTILLLNMRLVGIRFPAMPMRELARELHAWLLGSLAVMLASGFLLFSTEAVKMYGNWAFRLKMLLLVLAVLFTFTLHRRLTQTEETRIAPLWRWLAAALCVMLWAGVGLGGRAIGYVTTPASSLP